MLRELVKLADHLDRKGLSKEADFLDDVIKKAMDDREIEQAMKDTGYSLPPHQQGDVEKSFARFPVDAQGLMTPEGHDDGHSQALQEVVERIRSLSPEDGDKLSKLMTDGGTLSF